MRRRRAKEEARRRAAERKAQRELGRLFRSMTPVAPPAPPAPAEGMSLKGRLLCAFGILAPAAVALAYFMRRVPA